VATDGLGRSLPVHARTGELKLNRSVGIFYFLWNEGQNAIYDLTKLLTADPVNPAYGPPGSFHHWGEPLLGYYRQDDPFVLNKHMQMLSDAGIDVLFLDVTNALTYDPVCGRLCGVLSSMRAAGQKVPQIAFLANSSSASTVEHLYQTLYRPGRFRENWFLWLGKPLILTPPDGLSEAVKSFFTIRHAWAWTKGQAWFGDGRDKWPWLDHTPQTPGWTKSPDRPEQIVVCTAEHPVSNIGRSFHDGRQPPPGEWKTAQGLYFEEQWKRALEVAPPFVFITGWNEWVAQRFIDQRGDLSMAGRKLKPGETYFVDQFSEEFSRDIEPMKGGFGDAYFYQMVANIRRYKGTRALPGIKIFPVKIDGKFPEWKAAIPEYRDTLGDTVLRDHPGWQGQPAFVDNTARNDLAVAKITTDADTLFFYIRSRAPLTAPAADWMQLCLDTDANPATGWLGYDFIVNRRPVNGGKSTLEKFNPDGTSLPVAADIPLAWTDNELELSIPRTALNLPADAGHLDFKWLDNIPAGSAAPALTLHGDAAPNDRFNYRAVFHD